MIPGVRGRQFVLAVAVAVVCTILALVLLVAPAEAHTPSVEASCDEGLLIDLRQYERNTSLKVEIDGALVVDITFTGDYETQLPLQLPTVAHTWRVTIDNRGTFYDAVFTGTLEPCVIELPPVTTVPTTTTTAPLPPAEPPCPYPTALNFRDPECVPPAPPEVGTPAVEVRPIVIAFTG